MCFSETGKQQWRLSAVTLNGVLAKLSPHTPQSSHHSSPQHGGDHNHNGHEVDFANISEVDDNHHHHQGPAAAGGVIDHHKLGSPVMGGAHTGMESANGRWKSPSRGT
jgi:hypothetical protein